MTRGSVNLDWARTMISELAAGGVRAVCISPGSRSTPLTVAAAENPEIHVYSHLDERSAAYFAVGRARATGRPTPLICTSGTAAANFHPAVVEADTARVPMLLLTADRPRDLRDSGANQTIDQVDLFGNAVRWHRDLPAAAEEARTKRALRVTMGRALAAAVDPPAGPVHLNVPFRKPFIPVSEERDDPSKPDRQGPDHVATDREPAVQSSRGVLTPREEVLTDLQSTLESADRPLIVVGPADAGGLSPSAAAALTEASGAPLLADPLSGLRYDPVVSSGPILGGYDAYLQDAVTDTWPDPDMVVRFGASPTSKRLRKYLRGIDARQVLVDPAGGWREAEFVVTDRVVADPDPTAKALSNRVSPTNETWRSTWLEAEEVAREVASEASYFEGGIVRDVVAEAPRGAALLASNSMPVRDVDRFGIPRTDALSVYGNRGASGIDGVTSTALGVGSAVDGPLILLIGDLAYYHDMNGLLAIERCGVEATIVLLNNDGGGIFHKLPIAEHPTFETHFRTPHGLSFEATEDLYDLTVTQVEDHDGFMSAYRDSLTKNGTQVIEVATDAGSSHAIRERLSDAVRDRLT